MKSNLKLVKNEVEARQKLANLGDFLAQFDQADFEVKHTFAPGVYIREIFLPAGSLVLGKIHQHSHYNFLAEGEVSVFTKDGLERKSAPWRGVSTAGTQRAVYAVTDCRWVTVHHNPTDTQDLAEIEAFVIAPSYDALDNTVKFKELLE